MEDPTSIGPEQLSAFRRRYQENPISRAAANALSKTPLDQICFHPAAGLSHCFSLEIPTQQACDQKNSGRCWLFAALNLLREKLCKDLKLENFELSQSYLCFYDHLEKANTFYTHIVSTAREPLDSRYVSMLLSNPIGDGGWWEYFVGLCLKYGICPKDAMPETCQSSNTEDLNRILSMQLRKDALVLRTAAAEEPGRLEALKEQLLSRVYNVLAIFLGEPPLHFDFEYVDQDRKYHREPGLTPKAFYDRYLGVDLQNIVSILNAPIAAVPYHTTCYTQGEESICGVYQAKRLNLPMEEFKAAVIRQLQAGVPTWFVCDCDYYEGRKEGIWDTELYDYESLLGLDLSLSKGDLLNLRQCSLNHAMVLTGVNLVNGRPDKWKIQNSWGREPGKDGFYVCSDRWFDRYVYTASIHRDYLTQQQNRDFDKAPMVLPPWNVLG